MEMMEHYLHRCCQGGDLCFSVQSFQEDVCCSPFPRNSGQLLQSDLLKVPK